MCRQEERTAQTWVGIYGELWRVGRGEPSRGGGSMVVGRRTAGVKAQRSERAWHG